MIPTPEGVRVTPMVCARLMMRNHADPHLIVAFLRLELQRDPTIAMTQWDAFAYRLDQAAKSVGFAVERWQHEFIRAWQGARVLRQRVGPGATS